jgi:hypothetical protein
VIEEDLPHSAVLWRATGAVDSEDNPAFEDPRTVRCFWVDKQSQMLDTTGRLQAVDASAQVAEDIPLNSRLQIEGGPMMEVKLSNRAPSPRGFDYTMVVGMTRYSPG